MPVISYKGKPNTTSGASRTPKFTIAFVSTVLLSLSLVACSNGDSGDPAAGDNSNAAGSDAGSDASNSEVEELYEAAKEEGSVVWYSSTPDNDVAQLFQETYPGIDVEFVRLPAGQLATRYVQEVESGAAGGDIITIADDSFIDEARGEWLETELDLPALEEFPEEFVDDGIVTLGIATYGFVYNTQNAPGDGPQEWTDLLESEYSGQIMMGDPRNVAGYLSLAYLWKEEYGIEFLEELANQDFKVQDSGVAVNESIAAGAAMVSANSSRALMAPLVEAGAPLEFSQPTPTTGSEFYTGLSKEAANPAAAKLLMNFLLTEDAQKVFNLNQVSPYGVIGEGLIEMPEGYRYDSTATVEEDRAEILKALGLQ